MTGEESRMRRYEMIGAGVLLVGFAGGMIGGLAGCGDSGDDKPTAAAAPTDTADSTPEAPSTGDLEAKLMVANQGYVDALVKGDLGGAVGYLDPKVCDDDDSGSLAFAVSAISKTADGATMKITRVELYDNGTRGGAADYELSKDASDAFRRLVKSSLAESKEGSWRYHDGEWYLAGPCEDDS